MEGVGMGEMGASDGCGDVQVQDAALKISYTQGELRFLKSQVSSSVVSMSFHYCVSLRVSSRPSMTSVDPLIINGEGSSLPWIWWNRKTAHGAI